MTTDDLAALLAQQRAELAEQEAGRQSQLEANERHQRRGALSVGESAGLEQSSAELRDQVRAIQRARRR